MSVRLELVFTCKIITPDVYDSTLRFWPKQMRRYVSLSIFRTICCDLFSLSSGNRGGYNQYGGNFRSDHYGNRGGFQKPRR